MSDLGVFISVHNAEYMIKPCIESVRKVFPEVLIVDVGSEDDSVKIAQSLGVDVAKFGRLSGEEYTDLKEEMTTKTKYAFWTDADEVWPEESLELLQHSIGSYDVVNGLWRNLKVIDDKVMASDLTGRGAVAWNTEKFRIHRTWPREKLSARLPETNRADVQIEIPEIFSWHGVLLNISPLPDKKARWKKRAERNDSFAKLGWVQIWDMPFEYDNEAILDKPTFEWYK